MSQKEAKKTINLDKKKYNDFEKYLEYAVIYNLKWNKKSFN